MLFLLLPLKFMHLNHQPMKKILATLSLSLCIGMALAQDAPEGFKFTSVKDINVSPVKDQQRTGTCWSYATTSFIEAELLRMGKPEIDLSEMYFARHAYANKAKRYVRFQGTNNFGQGGQAHDVLNVIDEFGMVTEEAFTGKNYGSDQHVHSELEAVLKSTVEAVVKNPNRKLSTAWYPAINGILDSYFGAAPEKVNALGASVSPKEFVQKTGFSTGDYVEITSYNHHPYYSQFVLEIPDNWSHALYYNLPLNELMQVMEHAITSGYTVCWDGDVSEKGFKHNKGVAIIPASKVEEMADSEKSKWTELTAEERAKQMYSFTNPVPEVAVTQELRQEAFDNYLSTDDHLMHLTGIAKDQNGTKYFKTKNSWGTQDHIYGGYLYMSDSYVRLKTVAILIHKDALPKDLAKKLGIK